MLRQSFDVRFQYVFPSRLWADASRPTSLLLWMICFSAGNYSIRFFKTWKISWNSFYSFAISLMYDIESGAMLRLIDLQYHFLLKLTWCSNWIFSIQFIQRVYDFEIDLTYWLHIYHFFFTLVAISVRKSDCVGRDYLFNLRKMFQYERMDSLLNWDNQNHTRRTACVWFHIICHQVFFCA